MEDINIPVETEEVTPDAEVETTVEETAEAAEDTTPAAETEETTETAEVTEPITVPIRFNHESKHLTIDEAATYAQKGMAAEPVMSKLRYLSAILKEPVNQVVDSLLTSNEKARKDELLEQVNGNEELAEKLLKAERTEYQKAVDEMIAAEKSAEEQEKTSTNDRLANDFIELQKEVPEISSVDKVPKAVMKEAVDKNISLLDAYLRHQHKENKNIKAATETQKAAEKSTTGTAQSATNDGTSPEIEAMLQGMWG